MLKNKIFLGCLCLLIITFFHGNIHGAPITNEDCMGCHGEKELTGKGPGGKTVSLFFDKGPFEKSVHSSLQCVKCHEIKELPHAEKVNVVSCRACHGDAYGHYRAGVHGSGKTGKATCKACHGYHTVQAAKSLSTSLCAGCHGEVYKSYEEGIHAHGTKGVKEVATCRDCHGKTHDMLGKGNPRSPVYDRNLPGTCSRCHANPEVVKKYKIPEEKVYSLYLDSIHGKALTKTGLPVSAACNDCHGSHAIKPHTDPSSSTSPLRMAATCGKCHEKVEKKYEVSIHWKEVKKGNAGAPGCATCHQPHEIQPVKTTTWMLEAIRECGNCHASELETYHHSYHGKITNLGFTRVAKCADCHGAHNVLPESDTASPISKKNIVGTCGKCHPGSNRNFAEMMVHADYRDKAEHPLLYYVWLFMTILLISVFGFFGIHTILWLPRSWIERFRARKKRKE